MARSSAATSVAASAASRLAEAAARRLSSRWRRRKERRRTNCGAHPQHLVLRPTQTSAATQEARRLPRRRRPSSDHQTNARFCIAPAAYFSAVHDSSSPSGRSNSTSSGIAPAACIALARLLPASRLLPQYDKLRSAPAASLAASDMLPARSSATNGWTAPASKIACLFLLLHARSFSALAANPAATDSAPRRSTTTSGGIAPASRKISS
eukprot:5243182-Prymnesium_polylepis.1